MTASLAKPARPDSATLVRQLDASLQEFDRQMEIVLAEIATHAALADEYETFVRRQRNARQTAACFVVEAAGALLRPAGARRRAFVRSKLELVS